MEPKKINKDEDKLEKELKTLVSKMKSENSALNKILNQLTAKEEKIPGIVGSERESIKKKK
jgi:hypothetical protein